MGRDTSGSGEAATDALWFDLREKLGATEFLGYDTESAEGVVTGIVVAMLRLLWTVTDLEVRPGREIELQVDRATSPEAELGIRLV